MTVNWQICMRMTASQKWCSEDSAATRQFLHNMKELRRAAAAPSQEQYYCSCLGAATYHSIGGRLFDLRIPTPSRRQVIVARYGIVA